MKFMGVALIVITILFAISLRLAESEQEVKFAPEPGQSFDYDPRIKFVDEQAQCSIVMIDRVGEQPVRVTVDLECYGRRKVVIKEDR